EYFQQLPIPADAPVYKNSWQDRNNLSGFLQYSKTKNISISTDYLVSKLPYKYIEVYKNLENFDKKNFNICFSGFSFLNMLLFIYLNSEEYANMELRKIFNNQNPKTTFVFLNHIQMLFSKIGLHCNVYLLIDKSRIQMSKDSLQIAKKITNLSILQANFQKNNVTKKVNSILDRKSTRLN